MNKPTKAARSWIQKDIDIDSPRRAHENVVFAPAPLARNGRGGTNPAGAVRTAGEIRAARMCAREERRAICMFCVCESEGEGGEAGTHVEGFKVFADLSDELFAALVALREPGVWVVYLTDCTRRVLY